MVSIRSLRETVIELENEAKKVKVPQPTTPHEAYVMASNELITSYYPGLSPKEMDVLRVVIETAEDFHGFAEYNEVVARTLHSALRNYWQGSELNVYDIIDRLVQKKILHTKPSMFSAITVLLDFEEYFLKYWDVKIQEVSSRYHNLYEDWINNPENHQKQSNITSDE